MLETIDHIIVAVRDLAKASDAYAQLLGRQPSWRGRHPQQGTANTLFQLANTYIELLAPEGEGFFADSLRRHLDDKGEGIFGVAFGTGDIDAACRQLRERGIPVGDASAAEGTDEVTGAIRRWKLAFLPAEKTRGILAFLIEHDLDSPALEPAPLDAERAACVAALDHIVLRTADPEAAIALYRDALGIRLALDRSFEERGVRLIFFRLGGVTFEVAAALGDTPVEPAAGDQLWGLAYQVPEVGDARERLMEASIHVSEIRHGNKPGTAVCTVQTETHGVPTLLIGPG